MVSNATSTDWVIPQVLVYERKKEEQKRRLWQPWIWRLILWGIPIILVWGVLGVYVPVIVAELKYRAESTKESFREVVPAGLVPQLSFVSLPAWVSGYAIEIPKIGVKERVVEGVSVVDEAGYMKALNEGVAQAQGTGLPGEQRTQYYFAHSSGLPFWGTRAVVFALLNKLENGDEIIVYRDNQKFVYLVSDKMVVNPDKVEWLRSENTEERVVLQTCWPIGTNWKRLLVIAEPIKPTLSGVDRGRGFGKISLAVKSQD
jgi:LPXTG-site transpeptidase (sortase) family protein